MNKICTHIFKMPKFLWPIYATYFLKNFIFFFQQYQFYSINALFDRICWPLDFKIINMPPREDFQGSVSRFVQFQCSYKWDFFLFLGPPLGFQDRFCRKNLMIFIPNYNTGFRSCGVIGQDLLRPKILSQGVTPQGQPLEPQFIFF